MLDLLAALEPRLDGGWGIDALLGEQTRDHDDLDAVIRRRDAFAAKAALGRLGFTHDRTAAPGLPARLVLRDRVGRQVDLHLIVHDTAGNGWQQLDDGAWGRYDAEGLEAWGRIGGRRVRCISPELQVAHHRHEPWTEKDRADIGRLADRFGLTV